MQNQVECRNETNCQRGKKLHRDIMKAHLVDFELQKLTSTNFGAVLVFC